MLNRYAVLMVTLATLGAAAALHAQIPPAQQAQQQQLQHMQEQMQRLDETMQRMGRIQERAQEMERLMLQDMERLRQQQVAPGEVGLQLQQQAQLRNQEQVRVMANALAGAAGEMTHAMASLRSMVQNSGGSPDPVMEQHMERLRLRMQETCDQMEAGLLVMQQLREHLNAS
jgi:hypothetical protein